MSNPNAEHIRDFLKRAREARLSASRAYSGHEAHNAYGQSDAFYCCACALAGGNQPSIDQWFADPTSFEDGEYEDGARQQLAALISAVRYFEQLGGDALFSRARLVDALVAYEATGDHNHGRGPIAGGQPYAVQICEGGDCWVAKARELLLEAELGDASIDPTINPEE